MPADTKAFPIGARVRWTDGQRAVTGEISEVFVDQFHRVDDGSGASVDATEDNPVYMVNRSDGDPVMKSHDELTPA